MVFLVQKFWICMAKRSLSGLISANLMWVYFLIFIEKRWWTEANEVMGIKFENTPLLCLIQNLFCFQLSLIRTQTQLCLHCVFIRISLRISPFSFDSASCDGCARCNNNTNLEAERRSAFSGRNFRVIIDSEHFNA